MTLQVFLGVTLEWDSETGLLVIKQTGLIKGIITALRLDDGAKGKFTQSKFKPLVKNVKGELTSGAFSHSSVGGMLLHLSGHTHPNITFAVNCCACNTHPNITFAVNCCACYIFSPTHLHELALKWIGCYLEQLSDQGMVMNPLSNVCKIDAYPAAGFVGMYGREEHTDPACTKKWTGFIIAFADCPFLWQK